MRRLRAGFGLVLLVAGCLGDPVGPGVLLVSVEGAALDTAWAGGPGEAIGPVRVRVTDDRGRPVPAAAVEWDAVGRNSQVLSPATQSDSAGLATAAWLLGTDAAEEQQLVVTARTSRSETQMVIRARAVPRVVSDLRVAVDTPAVLRVGDTLPVPVEAIDPYGNVFPAPGLTVSLLDSALGAIHGGSIVGARRGESRVQVMSGSVESSFALHVTQYVAAIVPDADTLRFTSLGDELSLGYAVVDDRGRVVADTAASVVLTDTAVVVYTGDRLRSRAGGVAPVRLVLGSVETVVVADVRQVPATLAVAVEFGGGVVTLPVGSILPLTCHAFDKNGFAIPGDVALVGSRGGTVTGTRCGDARIQRSGYDTLFFAAGPVGTRVPVIVSADPDSVGVLAAAPPLTTVERERFVGEDLAHPSILALRPLVQEILAEYGTPTSNLDRARALRDWIARTAVHPHASLHPDGSTSNLAVLPPGVTWADVNDLYRRTYADSLFQANNLYWWGVGYDGYAMLDRLLGTLDQGTGVRANDGMMVRVGPARYQIRDLASYRYPICTFQAIMLQALWAAAGLHGMLVSTVGHDPAAVFIPELGRWVYEDPTYNEEYLLDGTEAPLSPSELLTRSSTGEPSRLHAVKAIRPSFDAQPYIPSVSYIADHPGGFVIMGSQLNNRVVGIGGWSVRLVQIDVPRLAEESPFNNPDTYVRVSAEDAFPILGPTIEAVTIEDSVFVVRLTSTFPNHQSFQRRLEGGAWEDITDTNVLPVGACRLEYRSKDALGIASASTFVDVWVPRPQGFVESGSTDSMRREAAYCS